MNLSDTDDALVMEFSLWGLLSDLMGRKKSKHEITKLLDGSVELTETEDLANLFADFFGSI